jgi:acetyltransferase
MTTVHAPIRRATSKNLHESPTPLLRGPRDSMLALANVAGRRPFAAIGAAADVPDLADLLSGTGALSEHGSSLVLERLGVPFAQRIRAATPEEAAAAATAIGARVVVKSDGPAHKARFGGVVLGIETADGAAEAAGRLGGSVLVARQVDPGAEVLCGMTRDADFGPILAVGLGGVAVEELDSVHLASAPLDVPAAADLVAEGIDDPHGVVAATLAALGDLALAHQRIASVEVNPLIVGTADTVAVDALVVLAD